MAIHRACLWGVCLTISVVAACGRPSEAGVHVVITMDPSMAGGAYFDHVTVTAQGGGQSAIACFFPPDAPSRQAAVSGAGSADPCVDLLSMGTPTPPTAATWDLNGAPRTVNFVFPPGVTPTIAAYAALGQSAPVASANMTASGTSPDFPDAVLMLTSVTPSHCALGFAATGVENSALVCDAPPVTGCLANTTSAGCASTVRCLSGTARVVGADQGCGGGTTANMVWRDDAKKPSGDDCAPVVVVGRFVRCASGSPTDPAGCPLTTDCTPPPTSVGYANTDLPQQLTDITCLPPSLIPRALVLFFANERKSNNTHAYPFLVASPPATDAADACFFDVQSIFVASSGQIACPTGVTDGGLMEEAGDGGMGTIGDGGAPKATSGG